MRRAAERIRLIAWASAAILGGAGPACAQAADPPAQAEQTPPAEETEQPAPPEDEAPEKPEAEKPEAENREDEIVIVAGTQADQTRIDRRVYSLGNDPVSQSSTMLDVLARLPSVTVAPSGAVRLLGSPNVTIQVDGQAVPGASLDQVLRSISGSEVERIEVITNPSAAYPASGDGGIINIITRQRHNLGLTGAVTAFADNIGAYQFNASPTFTRGPWSFGGRLGGGRNAWGGDGNRVRETFATGERIEDVGHRDGENDGFYGGAVINYRPGERTRAAFNLNGFDYAGKSVITQDRSSDAGPLYTQNVESGGAVNGLNANFDFQQTGEKRGEALKFNLNLSSFKNSNDTSVFQQFADGAPDLRYLTTNASETAGVNAKLDYERPLGEGRLLAIGAALENSQQDIETALLTLTGAPIAVDYESALRGLQTTSALYATYQFDVGDWTFLPGLRAEQYRLEVRSAAGESDDQSIDLFPSLHLRRNLAENWDFDLSYSRRIARRQINQLDPAIRYSEAMRGSSGNSDLQPTITNAFEANVVFQNRDSTYNFTLYDRISDGIVSPFTFTNADGVLLTMPVNAGSSEQRGAQLILRAPIARGWRYSVSANLLNREFDAFSQGVLTRRSEVEHSGNAQVEYRDSNQSKAGADHVQLELQFQGPQYELQGERDEFITANFTWRRRLTDNVAAVFSVHDIFDSAPTLSELRTDDFVERTERRGVGTRVRLTLTYAFGGAQPQEQSGGPSAPPIPQ